MNGEKEIEFNAIWKVSITILHAKSLVECATFVSYAIFGWIILC